MRDFIVLSLFWVLILLCTPILIWGIRETIRCYWNKS